MQKDDLKMNGINRTNFVYKFKRKQHPFYRHSLDTSDHYKYAMAIYKPLRKVEGVQARINLWQPSVASTMAESSSQIWIKTKVNGIINTIEAGWHRNAQGTALGCYNLVCPGFVQNDNVNMIGQPYNQVSTYDGLQCYSTIQIVKHLSTGHWGLIVENIPVGHWSSHNFTHLAEGATHVYWGGKVWSINSDNERISKEEMGSGRYAQEGNGRASSFDSLGAAFQNEGFHSVTPHNLTYQYSGPCYSISHYNSGFFYGGPGVGPLCIVAN
ncbi:uncharacterized protein LOC120009496 [Tripterygium wilfordii]|uniref:uncharacterized protein LOC120009496 n=1 Tax=Tripterygium wilfordii TaxID=458696 RepID=UPI0018F8050A|nr:uncharacterized protein LOC120009496 [Tripterygium wilfordii]